MAQDRILTDWNGEAAARFGRAPLRLGYALERDPLFSGRAVSELIERYPREHYSLVETARPGAARQWREGDFAGLSGGQVIDAIARGCLWLNLRNLSSVDARYGRVLDGLLTDLAEHVPGFAPVKANCGLLISSPSAQVYYHADLPGQLLVQIGGRKRVWIYPAEPPFLTARDLEDIALTDLEVGMTYRPVFDASAQVFDLAPGEMLHWPLNAPHRVENLGSLNVSLTVSYQTEEIRRAETVHLANAILRYRFGHGPRSRAIHGPGFWAKKALQKAMRNGDWVKARRRDRSAVTFHLDPAKTPEGAGRTEAAA